MFHLVFVKPMHQTGSVAVVAIRREFSEYSSEIFDEIFLFLCCITESSCSQMCVPTRSDDMNKV